MLGRISFTKTISITSILLLLFGCADVWRDVHFYDGPELEKDQVGMIHFTSKENYRLKDIDSTGTKIPTTNRLYLLPGEHKLFFVSKWGQLGDYYHSIWELKSEVLLKCTIEAGHEYRYKEKLKENKSITDEVLRLSAIPYIEDVTNETKKKIVSQTVSSETNVYMFVDKGRIRVFRNLVSENVDEYNRSTSTVSLLTFKVPFDNIPPDYREFIAKKEWYSENDDVTIALNHVDRTREVWPNWVRTTYGWSHDVFIKIPNGGWYCWPYMKVPNQYVRKLK